MIYWKLFFSFLKIGALSFGGGYGMIALIREDCLANGWLTEEQLLNFIAVAESTPGPIAVNISTFVGSSQAGFWGALVATLGIVLPSFFIILLIASLLAHALKYAGVRVTLESIRPALVGMILSTALTMFLSVFFRVSTVESEWAFDWRSLGIFLVLAALSFAYSKRKKKTLSPIWLIVLSGVLGVVAFGI